MKAFSDFINESKLEELGAIGVALRSADIKDNMIITSVTSVTTNYTIVDINTPSLTGDQLMILAKGGLKLLEPNGKGIKLKF
jgi:hypothetical protein